MKGSPNNSKDIEQSSTYSNSSSIHYNNNIHDQSSGITSMLSPRNIMKFFSKNIQDIASPRIQSFIASTNSTQIRASSRFTSDQIYKEFSRYIQATKYQMEKYKVNQSKKLHVMENRKTKQQEREQLQQLVLISKIPKQYFQEWEEILQEENQEKEQDKQKEQQELNLEKKVHKSMKLHALLVSGDNGKDKKKSKEKRRPLYQKQVELQGYLDDIQLVIFNKTRKYPDRYLHYLSNLDNSDIQICSLLNKVSKIRVFLGQQLINVRQKHLKVIRLEDRKKNLTEVKNLMDIMRSLYKFKRSSENHHNKKHLEVQKKQNNQNEKNNLKSTQLIKFIHQHPKVSVLYKISSVSETLTNASELVKKIREKKLQKICRTLHKELQNKLNNMYSRESWLKSQLPKDAIMIQRMSPQIQKTAKNQSQEQGNLNNSYLNISVLDQSYCVGSTMMASKKQSDLFNFGSNNRQTKQLIEDWKLYLQEYSIKNEEQQEQIFEIFQRVLLKFTLTFNKDLEDYITFIYNQSFNNLKAFSTHKERMSYIQPKLFNKMVKLYFQALSSVFTYALIFKNLHHVYTKLLKITQQKINEIISMKSLTQYSLVQNQIISYEDVVQVVNTLDYWCEYASEVGDKYQYFQQGDGCEVSSQMLQFEQTIVSQKGKIIQQYLANLHKFALISDLKSSIEKSDFSSISIPVYSFSILDFIINWGQNSQQNPNSVKINQAQQSFCFGSSFLVDLQTEKKQIKKNKKFSIFKVIDKKLIIQGKQYKLCDSTISLSMYLGIYLKAKVDFSNSSVCIDERICQLIGFYIWYCKKLIFTVVQPHNPVNHSHQKTNEMIPINRKTINNLCMLINLCHLLTKFMDILNITSKQKKVDKIFADLQTIKADLFKQITMLPFMQVQHHISNLYESRLKTRKQIPTKETLSIIETIEKSRNSMELYFDGKDNIKKGLQNTVKMICKNYFGYLMNMEHRGKSQLKCFLPKFKDVIGDIFQDEILALEKQLRY